MTKEYDIYRDSALRYMGYANEVGEAFRPLIPRSAVTASYVVATGYVCADTFDKSYKMYTSGGNAKQIALTAGDVFVWQMLASVIIPGFTINRVTWLTRMALLQARAAKQIIKTVPTAVGLGAIPVIIHPIDHFVDYFIDKTYRKWVK